MKCCVLTCTGQRPELFAICRRIVERQTRRPDLWLVSTDTGEGPDSLPVPEFAQRLCFTPEEAAASGCSVTQPPHRNLILALGKVPKDHAVIIMEDDDWYQPDHVELMMKGLEAGNFLVGSTEDRRYQVFMRRWLIVHKQFPNCGSTGLSPQAVSAFATWCARGYATGFWRGKQMDLHNNAIRVAIKGAGFSLPGRGRDGHESTNKKFLNGHHDPDCVQLRRWCGAEADDYLRMVQS